MTLVTAYSRGWGSTVKLGSGQEHARSILAAAIRHPSRAWHDAPTLRAMERAPSTAHRLVHRLAALGVIAIQATLGRDGGIRFTFGVRRWRTHPVRAGMVARMSPSLDWQLSAWEDGVDAPDEPEPPPRPSRVPWADRPAPRLVPTPDGRRPTFREELERHGFRVPEDWGKRHA